MPDLTLLKDWVIFTVFNYTNVSHIYLGFCVQGVCIHSWLYRKWVCHCGLLCCIRWGLEYNHHWWGHTCLWSYIRARWLIFWPRPYHRYSWTLKRHLKGSWWAWVHVHSVHQVLRAGGRGADTIDLYMRTYMSLGMGEESSILYFLSSFFYTLFSF